MGRDDLVLDLDHTPHAPRTARQQLVAWLAAIECSDKAKDDMAVVVSELVTNAVTHGNSAPRLCASHRDGRWRVEVYDSSHRKPAVRPSAGASGGYGLKVVGSLVDDWGWHFTRNGKVVWAEAACA